MDFVENKFTIVKENTYSGTLTVHILSLCVTLAADLFTDNKKKRRKLFFMSQLSTAQHNLP